MTRPAMVLVPGMLCDADLWTDIEFPRGIDVMHAPIDAADIDGMADQVMASVDGPFVLVGLSLGAIAGFRVAARATADLAGFCVVSANAAAPTANQLSTWSRWSRETADGEFGRIVHEEILPTMFAERNPDPALRRRFIAMAERVGPETFRRQLSAQATRTDMRAAVSTMDSPALVVGADRDVLCPEDFHRDIARALPNSRHRQVPGAGHLSPWEAPHAVGDLLTRFLEPVLANH